MRSPVDFLEEQVLPNLRVEQVYGDVQFTNSTGRWWRGRCPLHDGDGPNFAVDTVSLRFRCHSRCGGGTVVDYVNGGRKALGAEYVESVRKLADLAGSDPDQMGDSAASAGAGERGRSDVLDAVLELTRLELSSANGEQARAHLARVLPSGTDYRDLDLGVFPQLARVHDHLVSAGFEEDAITASGVLVDRRWAGRLVGAWRDRPGCIRTLFARDVTGTVEAGQKYLLLRGTDKAQLVAYGLDVALPACCRGRCDLVLGEGFFDAIVPQVAGLHQFAALGGSFAELTVRRLAALRAMPNRAIVIMPDFDPKAKACEAHRAPWCEPCAPGAAGAACAVRAFAATHDTPEMFVVPPRHLYEAAGSPMCEGAPAKVDPADLVLAAGVDVLRGLVAEPVHAFRYLADHMIEMNSRRHA